MRYRSAAPLAKRAVIWVILASVLSPLFFYTAYRVQSVAVKKPPDYVTESLGRFGYRTEPNTEALQAWQSQMMPRVLFFGAVFLPAAVAGITSIVYFMMWFYRMYRNLWALGNRHVQTTPGWAVGWWFIPVVNLIVPYQLTAEVWRGSLPTRDLELLHDLRCSRTPPLLPLWWALMLAPLAVGVVFNLLPSFFPVGRHYAATSGWPHILQAVFAVLGGAATVGVIVAATKNQLARADILRGAHQ